MTEFLFQMGLSNAFFSLVLAIAAMIVGVKTKRCQITYLLWLLVLIKLVTPPIVRIPVVAIPQQHNDAVLNGEQSPPEQKYAIDAKSGDSMWVRTQVEVMKYAQVWFAPIWLCGSMAVFFWSLFRVFKFNRLLLKKSDFAPDELQTAAAKIANRLKLRTVPAIYTTSAHISPMVWWIGGKVRIFIPAALLSQMDYQQWQWILAHEMAHVRRCDYLVRWLEWVACVCFWWNPVVLLAQRNLRAMEEICCDELVLNSLNPKPKFYANSLLKAVEFLAQPVLRPPAIASEINSGGFLERRFKMIIANKSNRTNSRWIQAFILICAAVVIPLGFAAAKDYEAVGKRLKRAVDAGELTAQQARVMLSTIQKSDTAKTESAAEAGISPERVRVRQQAAYTVRAERQKNVSSGTTSQNLAEIETELRKQVAEGKISNREARVKIAELRKKQAQQDTVSSGDKTPQDTVNIKAQLQKDVAEGKITKEQARAKITALNKQQTQQGTTGSVSKTRQDIAGIRAQLQKDVAEGRLTKEQARTKLAELQKKQAQQTTQNKESVTQQRIANIKAQLQKDVAEGKLSKEEAQTKLQELRKKLAEQKSAQ